MVKIPSPQLTPLVFIGRGSDLSLCEIRGSFHFYPFTPSRYINQQNLINVGYMSSITCFVGPIQNILDMAWDKGVGVLRPPVALIPTFRPF